MIIHLLSVKDWNHNFEVISSDEKHKLSVMFVKPEGLLDCIKLSLCFSSLHNNLKTVEFIINQVYIFNFYISELVLRIFLNLI